jgi:hypothetical protein
VLNNSPDASMIIGVGYTAITPLARTGTHTAAAAASLDGQIRQDKVQLDDWATCVSSKSARGQAEIQRLSGKISAAKERQQRLEASPGSLDVWA